jgi:hypothetical protein
MTHFFDSSKGGKQTYKDTGPLTKKRMETVGPLIYTGRAVSVPPEHPARRNEPCCPGGKAQLADILQNRPKAVPLDTAVWLRVRTSSA